MRTLSESEKAKAYDEALKKMSSKLQGFNEIIISRDDVEEIFPDLNDYEDERVKQSILNCLKKMWGNCQDDVCGVHVEDAIEWIENKSSKEEKIDNIDESNPTFNFHVGQWIVATGKCVYCVVKIIGFNVTVVDAENNEYIFPIDSLNDARVWSIEDAKDGDVLVCEGREYLLFKSFSNSDGRIKLYCWYNGQTNNFHLSTDVKLRQKANILPATKEQCDTLEKAMKDAGYTFDFEKKELKKIEQKHTPKHKIGDTIYYNSFGELKSMIVVNVTTDSTDNPMYEDENGSAVFEKDLVEQKPAENLEHKWIPQIGDTIDIQNCLNKISQEIKKGFQEAIMHGVEGFSISPDGHVRALKKEEIDEMESKQEWSQDDEGKMKNMLLFLDEYGDQYYGEISLKAIINWLKSLKDRVQPQPKQEWSEEDEGYFNSIARALSVLLVDPSFDEINLEHTAWFKSLKDRYAWKPTKEQMDVLLSEVDAWTKGCPKQKALESLYNDLKKLFG